MYIIMYDGYIDEHQVHQCNRQRYKDNTKTLYISFCKKRARALSDSVKYQIKNDKRGTILLPNYYDYVMIIRVDT